MKISASPAYREGLDHDVVDADATNFRLDSEGNVICTIRTRPIDLTHGTEYNFFVSINPKELDALYRFSMAKPKPRKEPFIRRV